MSRVIWPSLDRVGKRPLFRNRNYLGSKRLEVRSPPEPAWILVDPPGTSTPWHTRCSRIGPHSCCIDLLDVDVRRHRTPAPAKYGWVAATTLMSSSRIITLPVPPRSQSAHGCHRPAPVRPRRTGPLATHSRRGSCCPAAPPEHILPSKPSRQSTYLTTRASRDAHLTSHYDPRYDPLGSLRTPEIGLNPCLWLSAVRCAHDERPALRRTVDQPHQLMLCGPDLPAVTPALWPCHHARTRPSTLKC